MNTRSTESVPSAFPIQNPCTPKPCSTARRVGLLRELAKSGTRSVTGTTILDLFPRCKRGQRCGIDLDHAIVLRSRISASARHHATAVSNPFPFGAKRARSTYVKVVSSGAIIPRALSLGGFDAHIAEWSCGLPSRVADGFAVYSMTCPVAPSVPILPIIRARCLSP